MQDMPFFMKNAEWYFFDYEKRKYMLKKDVPKKAKESYERFYKEPKRGWTL